MQANNLPFVTVYTDGACVGNPGPGGYGCVLLHEKNGRPHRRELSGGYRLTTNNRMEIMAVIVALENLKTPCRAVVYSDSEYVVKAISLGWAKRWEAKKWMVKQTKPRINADLWERLLRLCEAHQVQMQWVKGHNGNRENERCDMLAETAARQRGLLIDSGFEAKKEIHSGD